MFGINIIAVMALAYLIRESRSAPTGVPKGAQLVAGVTCTSSSTTVGWLSEIYSLTI
jgi:hypothetical protein